MSARYGTPCPSCYTLAERSSLRMMDFALDGVHHRAPEMWIAARERAHTGTPIEQMTGALRDWADHCVMERLAAPAP